MPRPKSIRLTVKELITGANGLGYCCEWIFFNKYRKTAEIALRLGVTTRAVRYHKSRYDEGELSCEKRDCCLKFKIPTRRIP